MSTEYGLGRKGLEFDPKNLLFSIRAKLAEEPSKKTKQAWNPSGWWGDQQQTSKCVGFGFAHYIEDGPVTHKGQAPIADPNKIYEIAQDLDQWPGNDYDGTSVLAGAKALVQMGFIKEYRWAYTLSDMIEAVLELGPVVVGTNWYEAMFKPDEKGLIKIGGDIAGGHCWKVDAVNVKTKLFRLKNSWGREWGRKGFADIRFLDMERLIHEDGEICIATEFSDKFLNKEKAA